MAQLTKQIKAEIDAMDYEAILKLWRFTDSTSSKSERFFEGASFEYLRARRDKLCAALPAGARVEISKRVGWVKKPHYFPEDAYEVE